MNTIIWPPKPKFLTPSLPKAETHEIKKIKNKRHETTEMLEMQTWVEIISTQMHAYIYIYIYIYSGRTKNLLHFFFFCCFMGKVQSKKTQ